MKDYWGKDIPVRVGTENFDEIRFEYYRDSTVLLEALKGDQYDFRIENSAKNWATGYDFPAAKDGRVVREEFAERASGGMQAFAFNLRRPKFQDARVRRAFNLAFDFEEMNKQIFYGQYQRIKSYFEGTELASSGLPEGKEMEILESVRDKVPPQVFTTPYVNPVNGNPQAVRENLREADRLLKEAGWEIKGGKRVNAKGEHLTVEFLGYDPTTERYVLFYKPALERLGIGVGLRVVDPSQYENRTRDFDFDMVTELWGQSLSPGNEQRDFWGSESGGPPRRSRNTLGIKDPGIDALIDRVIFAKDRDELVAATKALDRVLLAHDFVVPQWTYPYTRTARWNRFGRPATMPKYAAPAFPTIWWWDAELARKTGSRQVSAQVSARLTRRSALLGGAAVLAALNVPRHAGRAGSGRRAPRHVHLRRAEIRPGRQGFRLCEARCAQGRRHGPADLVDVGQPGLRHVQHAERLRAQGRRRGRHGHDLRHADGACAATSPTRSTASWRAAWRPRPTG